jgi:hypothetical protein
MTTAEKYGDLLAVAEADLRRANTNVEVREADVARAQAACAEARDQQAKMRATCDWLRERLSEVSDEEAAVDSQAAQPEPAPAQVTKSVPVPSGTLFGKPIPEVTNTGLCLRALEQLGKPATTREIREKVRELGHQLDQDQVRGSLKYLAGRKDSWVENPEKGVWLLRREDGTGPMRATVPTINGAVRGS